MFSLWGCLGAALTGVAPELHGSSKIFLTPSLVTCVPPDPEPFPLGWRRAAFAYQLFGTDTAIKVPRRAV